MKHKPDAGRAAIINKAAALIHAHVDDFASLATLDWPQSIARAAEQVAHERAARGLST